MCNGFTIVAHAFVIALQMGTLCDSSLESYNRSYTVFMNKFLVDEVSTFLGTSRAGKPKKPKSAGGLCLFGVSGIAANGEVVIAQGPVAVQCCSMQAD